ncbi:MAG TPA: DUF434 domain-containing protein [Anaerohalosphaeraceae bacterium]|nr:DUF434 domain-containing protein [Anaerohalosphaeraceae bacterium]
MPDKRTHRGPHPEDRRLFAPDQIPLLQKAVSHYSWLLSRGYAPTSALKLVGDHFSLDSRQRLAVMRSACTDTQRILRKQKEIPPSNLADRTLLLDGYNILITLEAALGGAVLLIGQDGCIRDLSGLHGTWRKVSETLPAVELAAETLKKLNPKEVLWLLDRPVSNSGRLKALLEDFFKTQNLPWQVEIHQNPDQLLRQTPAPVATSDSAVLDECPGWFNLTREVLNYFPSSSLFLIDLSATNEEK